MRVIYELDLDNPDSNDKFNLKIFENSHAMYSSLTDISEILEEYRKGYIDSDDLEKTVQELLVDSKIYEIE